MATNKAIKEALLAKLGVTPQRLSQLVNEKKQLVPMSTEHATYVIAHENGVKIEKKLEKAELAEVRELVAKCRAGSNSGTTHPTAPKAKKGKPSTPPGPREMRFADGFKINDPVLPAAKVSEAREMAVIYPYFYALENSIREVVKRVMNAKCGPDWFDTQLLGSKMNDIRQKVAGRMSKEKKQSWHQRRGDHAIDYTDLEELGKIIDAKQDLFFPAVISDRDMFASFMRELVPSRNVVCHMNPLDEHNIQDVKLKYERWLRMISAGAANIPC